MQKFIKENRKIWSYFTPKLGQKKILIEEPHSPPITHANAIFALILNQAKGYVPVWIHDEKCQSTKLLQSYLPNAKFVKISDFSFFMKKYIFAVSFLKFLQIYFTKNILNFHFDEVKYGDILYDTYLSRNQVATIKKINLKLRPIIVSCIYRHLQIKKVLLNGNYAGVLVSHQVGISSGVMLRVALHYGYQGYLRCGHHQSTLQCFEKPDEVYDYEYKPSSPDIDHIINNNKDLKKEFLEVLELQISGKGNKDGIEAFSKKNEYYTDRNLFNKTFQLDPTKKNIFVMLHAFNDYPHSHFRWMIFKDYYDWFIQTLEYAKTNDTVNWIFKQHPSIKYYPMKDICMEKLFLNCPDNIHYIDENRQIDTRSLIYCANAIITCIGSAGFELPAMGGVPSITAGDNFYTQLGFALEPANREEYFKILGNSDKIEKLSPKKQRQAKAAYIFIYKTSVVSISSCPKLSMTEEKDKNISQWYWNKVGQLYKTKKDIILEEIHQCIREVAKHNFKQLKNLHK